MCVARLNVGNAQMRAGFLQVLVFHGSRVQSVSCSYLAAPTHQIQPQAAAETRAVVAFVAPQRGALLRPVVNVAKNPVSTSASGLKPSLYGHADGEMLPVQWTSWYAAAGQSPLYAVFVCPS